MEARWWYDPNGAAIGYVEDDEKSFYKKSGEYIGFRDGKGLYASDGNVIGFFDDQDKWIFTLTETTLGYLFP